MAFIHHIIPGCPFIDSELLCLLETNNRALKIKCMINSGCESDGKCKARPLSSPTWVILSSSVKYAPGPRESRKVGRPAGPFLSIEFTGQVHLCFLITCHLHTYSDVCERPVICRIHMNIFTHTHTHRKHTKTKPSHCIIMGKGLYIKHQKYWT